MHETKSLEFKQDISNSFLKTVSAFANFDGGTIIFGIADDGTEVGLSDPRLQMMPIEQKINESVSPKPDYTLECDDARRLIVLAVREGAHKPYLYNGKAYRRSDTSTVEVDYEELRELALEGANLTYDDLPAKTQDLTFAVLKERLESQLHVDVANRDVLRTLELIGDDGRYNKAAELLADVNSCFGVDIVRFGRTISIMLDRETHEHVSILSQYDAALALFRKYYRYEEIVGAERLSLEIVPEDAFREALANALVHRDWSVNAHIKVSFFKDRVEVSSPGNLPRKVTEEDYLSGRISVPRNPIIANVFFRLNLIERFGTGIPRIREAYEGWLEQPRFILSGSSITVVLPARGSAEELSQDEKLVLGLLRGNHLAISEIVRDTGFGKTKAQQVVKRLVEKGYAAVYGNGRGTTYGAQR